MQQLFAVVLLTIIFVYDVTSPPTQARTAIVRQSLPMCRPRPKGCQYCSQGHNGMGFLPFTILVYANFIEFNPF